MLRNIVLYLPKDREKPYAKPTLGETGNHSIDSLVQDVWGRSKPLHPDKLAYNLRQGHRIWMYTRGMPLEQLATMDSRVPFELYFTGKSEFWAVSARNMGNRRVRRTAGKIQGGQKRIFCFMSM